MQLKIIYKIKQFKNSFERIFLIFKVNWVRIALTCGCIIGIVILANNIYGIVTRGYQRYRFIQEEVATLNQLKAENKELNEELKYYSSYEYIDYKAREELNLIYPGSKLIYVDRGNKPIEKLDKYVPKEENEVNPSWRIWWDLIFK